MKTCPDLSVLAQLVAGDLGGEARAAVETHVAGCSSCRARLDAIVAPTRTSDGSGPSPVAPAPSMVLPTGAVLDRFLVIGHAGSGGMGTVYSAWDARLERRVALKVVRQRGLGSDAAGQARALGEAKAMAQLTHPNVVTVHDAFVHDDQLIIAMEYVEGATLRQWLQAAPRSRDERLRVLVEAGRGLEAAHRHGVLHRDFKPENVLVGADGRARVSDFGLARLAPEGEAGITATSQAGTRGYIAPEVLALKAYDHRADQYAFAVTAWEVLAGEKPPARAGALSGALRRVLLRGLEAAPAARHGSLAPFLVALEQARVKRGVAGAAVVAVTLLALLAAGGWLWRERDAPCVEGRSLSARAWSPERKAALETAVKAMRSPRAKAQWNELAAALDVQRSEWDAEWEATCRSVWSSRGQTRRAADARMQCQLRRYRMFDASTEQWAKKPPDFLALGAEALLEVESFAPCTSDANAAAMVLPEDDAAARSFLARRVELERLTVVFPGAPQAERLSYRPRLEKLFEQARAEHDFFSSAESASLLTQISHDEGSNPQVLTWGNRTFAESLRINDYAMAVRAAGVLIGALSERELYDEANRLATLAEAMLERIGNPPEVEWEYLFARAASLRRQKQGPAAVAALERARAFIVKRWGERSMRAAMAENNLGSALIDNNERGRALQALSKALSIREEHLGPNDGQLLAVLNNLAMVEVEENRDSEALAHANRGLSILDGISKAHPRRCYFLRAKGSAQFDLGELEAARATFTEAVELARQHGPRDVPFLEVALARTELKLGNLESAAKRVAAAKPVRPMHRAAAALVEAELVLARREDPAVARAALERAEAALKEDPSLFTPDTNDWLAAVRKQLP